MKDWTVIDDDVSWRQQDVRDGLRLQEFIRRVRHFRTEKGLTQKKLSSLMREKPNFITRLENGQVRAGIIQIMNMADYFEISAKDLIPDNI